MSSAPRDHTRRPPGGRRELHPDAVPLPLRAVGLRRDRGGVRLLQRMGEHQRAEDRRVARIGAGAMPFEPGEEIVVGRLQPVPDLLDRIELDAGPLRQGGLGQPRGDADAQSAGHQLDQREAPIGVERVEPARDQRRQLRLRRRLHRVHHLGEAGGRRVHPLARRPDQRHRLGEVADVVVAEREQHRVGARRHQVAHHRRLGGAQGQLAGQGGQADAAVGIRLRREPVAQQGQLGVPARREDQALQQGGEGGQAQRNGSGTTGDRLRPGGPLHITGV